MAPPAIDLGRPQPLSARRDDRFALRLTRGRCCEIRPHQCEVTIPVPDQLRAITAIVALRSGPLIEDSGHVAKPLHAEVGDAASAGRECDQVEHLERLLRNFHVAESRQDVRSRLVFASTVDTIGAHQPLSNHTFDGRTNEIRRDSEIQQTGIAATLSSACRVESTRWAVNAACVAMTAVSRSRISPTMITSGS